MDLSKFSEKDVWEVCEVGVCRQFFRTHRLLSRVPPVVSEVPWPHLLAYIFKEYKEAKINLINSEDNVICAARSRLTREPFQQEGIAASNIIMANLPENGRAVLPVGRSTRLPDSMEPFLLKEVARNDIDSRRYGLWGPERVILFGRSGCGKSSIPQMLVTGRLDPHSKYLFRISSSIIRRETLKVIPGEGRGWHVVDTPGFGESKASAVVAEKRIKKYVQLIEGTYAHYLYVVKKARIDVLEAKFWQFFLLLFGNNLLYHFTVVVTNADDEWVRLNRNYLEGCFEGCDSFVGVDFPPIIMDDDDYEADQQQMRAESVKSFEDELASRDRYDAFCDFGRFSKVSSKGECASGHAVRGLSKKLSKRIRAFVSCAYQDIMRLIATLTRDNQITLAARCDDEENFELLYLHG